MNAAAKRSLEPGMRVVHAYEGWGMEHDIRRNSGFVTLMVRRIDPRIHFSWLLTLGTASIPVFFAARLYLSCIRLLRLHRYYEVPAAALPGAIALAARLHWMEIPGMKLALAGEPVGATAYR